MTGCLPRHDPSQPCFEIFQIARQAQDRHHFRRDRDVEAAFARIAIGRAAERLSDIAQRPVVHVEHAAPDDPSHIDIERIAPMDVVVDHRREQIVRRGDGVEISGEMEIDVLHRHDLRITAAGCAALGAETWPERRFAQAQHRFLADPVERIGQPDRGGRLAFTRRCRVDRGDQDQLTLFSRRRDAGQVDLRFEMAVRFDRLGRDR